YGFIDPGPFRLLVTPGTLPQIFWLGGGRADLRGPLGAPWLGYMDPDFPLVGADGHRLFLTTEAIEGGGGPAGHSRKASARGGRKKVYLAGLGILQGLLMFGNLLAGQTWDQMEANWTLFELESYGRIVEGLNEPLTL